VVVEMFGSIGVPEILLILLVILILFGARRLPEIGKGLGKGIREFKKASREITNEITRDDEEEK
jgi:sec-independent protein translocase protein TatA